MGKHSDYHGKLTLASLQAMKATREPIACLTAYDASFARIIDQAGADLVLIGDSLGMVVQGKSTTTGVTMDDMVYHCRCVSRCLKRAFCVADMPFLSYTSVREGVCNARRLLQDGGAQMVKIEMIGYGLELVRKLAVCEVPVCAHIGFRPQLMAKSGYFSKQTQSEEDLLQQVKDCVEAGADLLLVECGAAHLGAKIRIIAAQPVIGIGSGKDYDGQILVMHDVLGISKQMPSFAQNFLESRDSIQAAFAAYVEAVKTGVFPSC